MGDITQQIETGIVKNISNSSLTEEQKLRILKEFKQGNYQDTIDLLLAGSGLVNESESFNLRSTAGVISLKYLRRFVVYSQDDLPPSSDK